MELKNNLYSTFIAKHSEITLKIISWIQIIGGLLGLRLIAGLLLDMETVSGPTLLLIFIGINLFIFSIYAGKRLFTDDKKQTGIILSLVNEFLQVFHWSAVGYGLSYSSGLEFLIQLKGLGTFFHVGVTSTFLASINSNDAITIKINLVAVLLLIILFQLFKNIRAGKQTITT